MIRGIYIAASGMLAETQRADVTANNLANASTAGFKKDFAIMKDYADRAIRRVNDGQREKEVGRMGSGVLVDEVATRHTQGLVRTTGNTLDFALNGKGFFAVETPAGIRYTRNGSFTRNPQGELVTEDGYRVQGQGGAINLDPAGQAGRVEVSEDGRIFLDGIENNTFQLVGFTDEKRLRKEGANLYRAPEGVQGQPVTPPVLQRSLEMSNVNVVSEMVNMITGYRAYETNSKVVQTCDETLDKAVNEVAKLI